jgi:hypothetical protein
LRPERCAADDIDTSHNAAFEVRCARSGVRATNAVSATLESPPRERCDRSATAVRCDGDHG